VGGKWTEFEGESREHAHSCGTVGVVRSAQTLEAFLPMCAGGAVKGMLQSPAVAGALLAEGGGGGRVGGGGVGSARVKVLSGRPPLKVECVLCCGK
jgi:hypothetical protein